MKTKFALILLIFFALHSAGALQAPVADRAAGSGTLRQLIPGHYVYSINREGRIFSSGVVVTNEGVLVFDALESEAIARGERETIAGTIKQPIRYLVSSPFHDPFSKGNVAYADVFKIGHENYRAGLFDQMQRGGVPAEEQQARMPNATFRDRMSVHLGGKEIQLLHFGAAHTKGDSILFVPQDRIAYMSEVFFNEEFPNMAGGYGVSWVRVFDAVEGLDGDIFVPGPGPLPEGPNQTPAAPDHPGQNLCGGPEGLQEQVERGATEDQAVAAVRLQQYEKLPSFAGQREVVLRRIYKELKGTLPRHRLCVSMWH